MKNYAVGGIIAALILHPLLKGPLVLTPFDVGLWIFGAVVAIAVARGQGGRLF